MRIEKDRDVLMPNYAICTLPLRTGPPAYEPSACTQPFDDGEVVEDDEEEADDEVVMAVVGEVVVASMAIVVGDSVLLFTMA